MMEEDRREIFAEETQEVNHNDASLKTTADEEAVVMKPALIQKREQKLPEGTALSIPDSNPKTQEATTSFGNNPAATPTKQAQETSPASADHMDLEEQLPTISTDPSSARPPSTPSSHDTEQLRISTSVLSSVSVTVETTQPTPLNASSSSTTDITEQTTISSPAGPSNISPPRKPTAKVKKPKAEQPFFGSMRENSRSLSRLIYQTSVEDAYAKHKKQAREDETGADVDEDVDMDGDTNIDEDESLQEDESVGTNPLSEEFDESVEGSIISAPSTSKKYKPVKKMKKKTLTGGKDVDEVSLDVLIKGGKKRKTKEPSMTPSLDVASSMIMDILGSPSSAASGSRPKQATKQTKKKTSKVTEPDPNEPVYCVCRMRESDDDGRMMVECDGCDQWFHFSCVGLDERYQPLLKSYICQTCDEDPNITKQTCLGNKCRRDDCWREALTPMSKYCSESCGIHYALDRLRTNDIDFSRLEDAVKDAIKPDGYATIEGASGQQSCTASAKAAERDQREKRRLSLERKRQHLRGQATTVARQQEALRRAVEIADSLPMMQLQGDALPAKSKAKKRKGGGSSGPTEDRPCGFDQRLLATSEENDVVSQVCMNPRKKCDRHANWQKMREVDLQDQAVAIADRLEKIDSQLASLDGQ